MTEFLLMEAQLGLKFFPLLWAVINFQKTQPMIHSYRVEAKFCPSNVTEQVSSHSLVAFLADKSALSHGSVLVSLYTLCCHLVPLTATWNQHSCSRCRIHSPRVCTNPFDHYAYTRCAYQCISNSKVSVGKSLH